MEERRPSTSLERRREASTARGLADQRDQIRRFLTELSEAADAAEQEIAESVRQLLADVSSERESVQSKREATQGARLAERGKLLDARETDLEAREEVLVRREAAAEETVRLRARLEERSRLLTEREEELEAEQQRTKAQRRRIADELKDEREAVRREAKRAAEQAVHAAPTGDDSALREQLREQLRVAEAALAERNDTLAEAASDLADLRDRLADYKTKLAETEARLTEAESRLADAEAAAQDAESRAADAALNRPVAADDGNLPMDWESQKRRMLASFEGDGPRRVPESDRLTIEGAMRITDGVVSAKEQEIERLQRKLSELETAAPAVVDALETQDEIIVRHRADIERLKGEWEAKVRAAEVELSLERAKLGRERTMLEERRLEFEAQEARRVKDAQDAPVPMTGPGDDSRKGGGGGGGRWLSRLGLRE